MSKTSARRMRQQHRLAEQRRSGRTFVFGVTLLIVILVAGLVVGSMGRDSSTPSHSVAEKRSDSASALDLVADVKTVALGHVPLNQTVTPTWRLTNNGSATIALGEPHAEVIEGCCPGPLQVGTSTLKAGESTDVTFPLQMHPGMDGPHEFSIHIPVEGNGAKDLLELTTTGHFSS